MKPFFLLVVAFLTTAPVLAQTPALPTAQIAGGKSGYELLLEAGGRLLPGPQGRPSATETDLLPEENLRRQRLAVARNAPALALVRQAIALPIVVPPEDVPASFPFYARTRELARQFSQESDVHLANGDFVGALNSKLDTMELGASVGGGSVIASLVGLAIEAIGVKDADKIAARLDAKGLREAIARMERIEARRRTLSQVLRDEQSYALKSSIASLAKARTAPRDPTQKEETERHGLTTQDIAQFDALTDEQLAKDNARVFDALVADAENPYSTALPVLPPEAELNLLTRGLLSWAKSPSPRFNFARANANHRLLRAALELRATKLETGAYPTNFNAPLDPFSPDSKPLVYRVTENGFLLYSVGPDGRDDGGTPFHTVVTNEQTGAQTERKVLLSNSSGDVVQAPF